MFKPDKPYNDLPFLPPVINLESKRLLKQLMFSKEELANLRGLIDNIKNKEIFLESFAIREAVESSQIENINTTIDDVLKSEHESKLPPEIKETLFYKDALLSGFELIKNKGFLSINDICSIGSILSPKGKIRTTLGVAIKKTGIFTSETIYTPPIGQNSEGKDAIGSLLDNLENFYNTPTPGIDPLIKMAMIHYQFECIHPFYDGNGRTGRILMVLYLVLTEKLPYPALFLSGFINQYKSNYYELIGNVTKKKQWEDYLIFMLKAIEVQAISTSTNIKKLHTYIENVDSKLHKTTGLKSSYIPILKDIISYKTYISIREIEAKLDVNRITAQKVMDILIKAGFGKAKFVNRNKMLYNTDLINIFTK